MLLPLTADPARLLAAAADREETADARWFDDPPPGVRHLCRVVPLADGSFAAARQALLSWQMHRAAGLRPAAGSDAQVGTLVVLTVGLGGYGVRAPCRVVAAVDEADSAGFTYVTLRGHPERGAERFMVIRDDGTVRFEVTAVSREVWWAARLALPVARLVQDRKTTAYLRAMVRLAR